MRKVNTEVVVQLEFDEVIKFAATFAKGPGASSLLDSIDFNADMSFISEELDRVSELKEILTYTDSLKIDHYEDIGQDLFYLSKENYSLEAQSILRINRYLLNFQSLEYYFKGKKKKDFSRLYAYLEYDDFYSPLIASIARIFDEQGLLRKNATPELVRIFKVISVKEKEIDKVFDRILADYKSKGLLTDNSESLKSGRRVLALPAENKRIVKGIIHDESSSGKTVFIEPSGVIQVNNELLELENEKRKEVYKILKELSSEIRVHHDDIAYIKSKVEYFDYLSCKANVALQMEAVKPEISDQTCLKIINAKHPLLKLKENKDTSFEVVAFDLDLKHQNRILLISGPNAGGKTVTLKALGLIHLMVYSGFLVPLDDTSVVGNFHSLFTNIGDLQNINEGLSTYSSHLDTMNKILKRADDKSLILIDEFGSGTDPKIGGAIAESMLRRFNILKAYGIITTHYSNLKVFAYKEKGIVNGAMSFDEDNLEPTYKLNVGSPGSSYAFEVAEKIGLHPALIKYARNKVGKKENAIEKLLVGLQKEKAEYDEKLLEIYDEKYQLDQLISSYQKMNQELIVKRKRHKIRIKEDKISSIERERAKLDDVIQKLTADKKLEEAKAMKQKLTEKRIQEVKQAKDLRNDIISADKSDYKIAEGDHVIFIEGDATGIVRSISNDNAEVLTGNMVMTVSLSSLKPIKEQLEINGERKINIIAAENYKIFSEKLDIRGYKYEDAARSIEEFLDSALLNNTAHLEIVHGKGNGVLRKLLLQKLKEYKDVTKVWHPQDEHGGQGITMVKF